MDTQQFGAWFNRHSARGEPPHRSPLFAEDDHYKGEIDGYYVDTRKARPLHTTASPLGTSLARRRKTYYKGQNGLYGCYSRNVEPDGVSIIEQLVRVEPATVWAAYGFGVLGAVVAMASGTIDFLQISGLLAITIMAIGFVMPLIFRSSKPQVHDRSFDVFESLDELSEAVEGRSVDLDTILNEREMEPGKVFHKTDEDNSKQRLPV